MVNLPFLSKSNKNSSKFLTLTITSDGARCLAFYKENGALKIIGASRQSLEPGNVRAGIIISKEAVITAVQNAVAEAHTNIEDKVGGVIIGVSGDLCLGIMTTIKARRGKATPITKKELDEIFEKINEAAYMQAQNEYVQITGNSEVDLDSITTSGVYTKLDNQKTTELEGKEGSVIETAIFNAFVPIYHLKTLQELTKKCGLQLMAIGSKIYAIVQAVVESSGELSDFVLVEIDGDYTNVAIVFGKGIVATRTLNVGNKHFIEGVSERMGITWTEANKMIKTYSAGKLTPTEITVVQNALRSTLEVWLKGMELLFREYSGVKTFPPKILVTGEGADVPDLWNLLTTEDWTKSIPFKASPDLKKLTFLDLDHISDATGKITTSEWLPDTCLSTIFMEMEENNND